MSIIISNFIKCQNMLITLCKYNVISEAHYLLYNYYYLKQGNLLKQTSVCKDIGRSSVTLRQYHEQLFKIGLIKFHNDYNITSKKIKGYKVQCVLPSLENIEKLINEADLKNNKLKRSREDTKKLIDVVIKEFPEEFIPKKWDGLSVRMLQVLDRKVNLCNYLKWVAEYKLKDRNYNWFVEGRLSSNSMLASFNEYTKRQKEISAFKDTSKTEHIKTDVNKLLEQF